MIVECLPSAAMVYWTTPEALPLLHTEVTRSLSRIPGACQVPLQPVTPAAVPQRADCGRHEAAVESISLWPEVCLVGFRFGLWRLWGLRFCYDSGGYWDSVSCEDFASQSWARPGKATQQPDLLRPSSSKELVGRLDVQCRVLAGTVLSDAGA